MSGVSTPGITALGVTQSIKEEDATPFYGSCLTCTMTLLIPIDNLLRYVDNSGLKNRSGYKPPIFGPHSMQPPGGIKRSPKSQEKTKDTLLLEANHWIFARHRPVPLMPCIASPTFAMIATKIEIIKEMGAIKS
jgi:hypothetical protein